MMLDMFCLIFLKLQFLEIPGHLLGRLRQKKRKLNVDASRYTLLEKAGPARVVPVGKIKIEMQEKLDNRQ